MLKFICKVFLISFLSGSLMLIDFSYKGSILQAAQAETFKTEKIDDKNLMGTLTMTAIGFLASRLYRYKMTTDIMVAAAGGVAYIAGEIMATSKLKEVMKGMEMEITRDKKTGKIDQQQIEALQKLKKSYEEAKKAANTKKMLQMAAAAAFAAAGILAFTSATAEESAFMGCQAAGTAAQGGGLATCKTSSMATCAGQCAGATMGYAACYAACNQPKQLACTSCSTTIGTKMSKMTAHKTTREAPAPSAAGLAQDTAQIAADKAMDASLTGACATPESKPMSATVISGCQPFYPLVQTNNSGATPIVLVDLAPTFAPMSQEKRMSTYASWFTPKDEKGLAAQLSNLFISDAHAGLFDPVGIASSAAIAFIMATSTSLSMTVDTFLLTPRKRAIVWGVLAGLVFMASTATDNVIKQIDENIKKIDAILNSLNSLANGVAANNAVRTNPNLQKEISIKPKVLGVNGEELTDLDFNGVKDGSLPCFTGPDTKKCPSFSNELKDLPSFNSLSSETQAQVSGILKTADGLNGASKISAGTINDASKLAAQANALKARLDRSKKELQDRLRARGLKDDLDAEEKNLAAQFESITRAQLKKQNSTASGMLASIAGGTNIYKGSAGAGSASDLAKKDSAASSGVDTGVNTIDIGVGGAGVASIGDSSGLGMGKTDAASGELTDEEKAAQEAALKSAQAIAPIDDYDLKQNDINPNKDSSIFDVISNRYQTSGYERLFNKRR